MDTVVGKRGTQPCLLVLTERKSRLQIIRKLKNKTMIEVVKTVREIIKSYPETIKEIENWMNNYPRKLFDRKSSNEIYEKSKKYIS